MEEERSLMGGEGALEPFMRGRRSCSKCAAVRQRHKQADGECGGPKWRALT